MTEKELQEKVLTYRFMEARLDGLVKQRDMMVSKIIELQSTLQSIDELDKSEGEILFPIGGEAYRTAKIIDKNKLIVDVGANVALEKTTEEGKDLIIKRKGEIEGLINQIQHEIVKVSNAMNQLGPELQEMTKQMQQAG